MSDDDRDPTDELLDRARQTLDRRRATMAALEDRHRRLRVVPDDDDEGEAPPTADDVVRDRWRARADERRRAVAERFVPRPPDDAA